MSFRFNFGSRINESSETLKTSSDVSSTQYKCRVHRHSNNAGEFRGEHFKSIEIADDILWYLNEKHAESCIESTELARSLENSDLLSGHYEGGLKVWECTYDLLQFMCNHKEDFRDKHVLDLGCGAGLLGVYAAKYCQAKYVGFQDYNAEVIDNFTVPTVVHNINKEDADLLYLSGDWECVCAYFRENNFTFDIVLSSETIYNKEYYDKVFSILEHCLNNDGYALFGAKSHYFGVGGGVFDFTNYINSKETFDLNSLWKSTAGLTREILKVKRNNLKT